MLMKLRKLHFPSGFKYKYFIMHFVAICDEIYEVNCLLMDKANTKFYKEAEK